MEGVASEASSLAGHLGLGQLIVFYDDNEISIDGPTSLSFSEDVPKRYEAYGWHVQRVEDGNDLEALDPGDRGCSGRRGPAVAHRGAHPHRLRQPGQAGHRGRPRLAARRRRGGGHQEEPGLARGAHLPRARRGPRGLRRGGGEGRPPGRRVGEAAGGLPRRPPRAGGRARPAAGARPAGGLAAHAAAVRPRRRPASPPARPRARCSSRSPRACPSWSAARPT